MKLIIDYYQFLNEYKENLTSMVEQEVSFVELLALYSIFIGKNTQHEIVDFLQKDRSQIHRLLKQLVNKKVIVKKEHKYMLTSVGQNISNQLIESNKIIFELLNTKVDLESFHQRVKESKAILEVLLRK